MHGSSGQTWDTTIVFVEREGHWWWNAWDPVGEIEHSGSAGSRHEAEAALAGVVTPSPS